MFQLHIITCTYLTIFVSALAILFYEHIMPLVCLFYTTGGNVCGYFNGGCSHLCFPTSPWSERNAKYTCSCPDGYDIESDNQTCTKQGRCLNTVVRKLYDVFIKIMITFHILIVIGLLEHNRYIAGP